MGHTKEVNVGTYQYPLTIMEITKEGKHLQNIDNGVLTIFIITCGSVVVVVNHCFTSFFGTKGILSDIVIR